MIRLVTSENEPLLMAFFESRRHPQLLKIKNHYCAYGTNYSFCRFYLEEDESKRVCGVAAFLQGSLLEYTEMRGFLRDLIFLTGAFQVSSNRRESIPEYSYRTGNIYSCSRDLLPGEASVSEGKIQRAFELLQEAFPEQYTDEMHDSWYGEMSHYIRHHCSRLFFLGADATATLLCEDSSMAVLNQIAVRQEKRGDGLGRSLLQAVCYPLIQKGKEVFVYSNNSESDRFYQALGFIQEENWNEWKLNK